MIAEHEAVAAEFDAGHGAAGMEIASLVDQLTAGSAVDGVVDAVVAEAFERIVGGENGLHPELDEAAGAGFDEAGARVLAPGAAAGALFTGFGFDGSGPGAAVIG